MIDRSSNDTPGGVELSPSGRDPVWRTPPLLAALERTPLTRRIAADVCVVGAGIFGLTTAYLLQSAGRATVVLDDGPIAGGQSMRTSAHLTCALDARYVDLERTHGAAGARLAADSHVAAIACLERIVREESVSCSFHRVDGFLVAAGSAARDVELVQAEYAAAARAGLAVELLPRAPLTSCETGPCVRFADQARFHPLLYLAGLARAFENAGGRIFTGSRADEIAGGDAAHVTTVSGARVDCSAVVVATNSPVNDRFLLHVKQAPYMTYVIAAPIPSGVVPDALLWDTADPYHYVRLVTGEGPDRLLIGGEDHKTGQANDGSARFLRLEGWARERFPQLGAVDHRWAGQVLEPADGIAYIGRNPGDDDVYVATGFSGNGLTYGTLAGMLVTDAICGRDNPWQRLYDPARLRLGGLGEMLRENLNVAARYAAWLGPAEIASEDDIPPGGGAVLRVGLARIAVHRDDAGRLHRSNATCPHLGCVVAWNGVERTWDCPCHGSRFDGTGRVIVGPANRDLDPAGSRRARDEETHGEQEQV